jgi:NAD(P)-dependent dehydrogenase (short-subunit alcohol dehydrogenase family)
MNARATAGMALALGALGVTGARALRRARAISFENRLVLIFGGSRGLGLLLAREFAAEGAHVVLAAREADELDRAQEDIELRRGRVSTVVCDVRDRSQVEAAVGDIVDRHGMIDVLVNNAGVIQVGPIAHMTIADFEDAMATHFWGPLYAILAALPHMRRTGARRIVNVSSIGGKIAVPHLVPYSASKFALTGLSEGLAAELGREGFRVTTVSPGLMRTGSTYHAWFKGQHRREFAWFHVSDSMPLVSMDARRAARQIVDACRHGDAHLILTPAARLGALVNAALPTITTRLMAIVNRLLPGPAGEAGAIAHPGWQSTSALAPSALTRLSDRASVENNEVP